MSSGIIKQTDVQKAPTTLYFGVWSVESPMHCPDTGGRTHHSPVYSETPEVASA